MHSSFLFIIIVSRERIFFIMLWMVQKIETKLHQIGATLGAIELNLFITAIMIFYSEIDGVKTW